MALAAFDVAPWSGPLPEPVASFLESAAARTDAFCARPEHGPGSAFVPSDHELVYRVLRTLRERDRDARRLCEWGSGLGVVTGLAALLGFEAWGIEVDPGLVLASRALLRDHGIDARIAEGSFLPEEFANTEELADLETRTVTTAAEAWRDMDLGPDDFDVVFAFPWPTDELRFCTLFDRYADYGAVLLTYSRTESVRAYRKLGTA